MSHRLRLGMLATLVIAACEQPTAPVVDELDDSALAQFTESISESGDVRLPSVGALLNESRETIAATDGGHAQAIQHFLAARRLALAAEDATAAGDDETAVQLERRSYGHKLQGVVAVLGSEAVARAVAGSTAGLERLQAHLADREVPDCIAARVAQIADIVSAANEQLLAGANVRALHQTLAAAEGIRIFSPRYVARKRIQRAISLLRQAVAAVGDAPMEEEATAIRRARRLLRAAEDELGVGHPHGAAEAAQRSARLSWGVVQGRATEAG